MRYLPLHRWIHKSLEEGRHSQSFGHGRANGQVGLGGVGRRENGARCGSGQASCVQGGHRHRAAVRHARAPATGPSVPAWDTMLPDDYDQ